MSKIKPLSNTLQLEKKYGIKIKIIDYTIPAEKLPTFSALISFWENWNSNKFEKVTKEDIKKHLPLLMMAGHHSIIEHSKVTFTIEGLSRSATHQLVRHRIATYTQQSQRYIKIGKPEYIIPESIKNNPKTLDKYKKIMNKIWKTYEELINAGIPKEDARFVLPNATRTSIVVTMNFRELLHVMELRMCYNAQWEIREIFWSLWEQMMQIAPHIFIHATPPCIKKGYCPFAPIDKHLYCGKMNEVQKRYKNTLKELGLKEEELVHKSYYIVNRKNNLKSQKT